MDAIQKKKMLKLIGNNIREWRRNKGYGLKELAEKVGVSPVTLNHYEAGRVDIPLSKLLLICKVLGVTPNSVIGGVEHGEAKQGTIVSKVDC